MTAKLRTWWQKIRKHWVAIGAVLVVVIALIIVGYSSNWAGFNGYNKISTAHIISGTNAGTTTRTEEYQPGKSLWDWLQLGSSIATTLALVAAAWWFIQRRASAKSLQITITLAGVTMVNDNIRVAIIRVQLKNTGLTRIKTYHCNYIAVKVKPWRNNSEPITPIEVIIPDTERRVGIFKTQIELEPNDVLSEDIALALNNITFFAVRVEFRAVGTEEAWGTLAIFNADEKTKGSSTNDLTTEQRASVSADEKLPKSSGREKWLIALLKDFQRGSATLFRHK